MNGRERIEAVLNLQKPDRVPVFPNIHWGTAGFGGKSIKEYATDADNMASCLIAAYKECDYDGVQIGSDVAIEGEAIGCKVSYPDNYTPSVIEPVLQDPKKIDSLRIPDPYNQGRMPVIIKATEIVVREVGNEAFVGSTMCGPLNCAGQLRGVENLMMDFYNRPSFVNDLLDFTVQVGIEYGKALIKTGADSISVGEALCSPNVISPTFYRDFVIEKQKQLFQALKDSGAKNIILHICGNITKILEDCALTGANVFDIDYMVDIRKVMELKNAIIIARGNLDPVNVLLNNNPEIVFVESKKLLENFKEKGRFILSSGCNISNSVTRENMRAMLEAAEKYGKYSD